MSFHPLAEADLVAAWSWYEERQPGLGDRLVRAVRAAIDMAAQWPSSGTRVIEGGDGEVVERRITTSGFPYAVRYRTIDEAIVVMAVYHQRRHPDFGAERSP